MITTYSADEMKAIWRLRQGLEPLRTDTEVERFDGYDVDSLLEQKIADWYGNLLLTADTSLLPQSQIAHRCKIAGVGPRGEVEVSLPREFVRLVSVKLEGWSRKALIVTDPGSPVALLQRNPLSQAGPENPVALHCGRGLTLFSSPVQSPALVSLVAVTAPTDGTFSLDPVLLSTIPDQI